MFFITKIVNNGYGETIPGFEEVEVEEALVYDVWSNTGTEDEVFTWNTFGEKERIKLTNKLLNDGFVVEEYEDVIVGVGKDRNVVIENMLKQV